VKSGGNEIFWDFWDQKWVGNKMLWSEKGNEEWKMVSKGIKIRVCFMLMKINFKLLISYHKSVEKKEVDFIQIQNLCAIWCCMKLNIPQTGSGKLQLVGKQIQ
jgi:hypothetical protein